MRIAPLVTQTLILRTPVGAGMMRFCNVYAGDAAAFHGCASLFAVLAAKLFQP
jgi:hypothetical protein